MKTVIDIENSFKRLLEGYKEWLGIIGYAESSVKTLPNQLEPFFSSSEKRKNPKSRVSTKGSNQKLLPAIKATQEPTDRRTIERLNTQWPHPKPEPVWQLPGRNRARQPATGSEIRTGRTNRKRSAEPL